MGWKFVVHGREENLLDEGIETLFLGGATDRLGLGDTERPGAVRCWCHITLHCENTLERLNIHLGDLGDLGQQTRVIQNLCAHLGLALLKLDNALLDRVESALLSCIYEAADHHALRLTRTVGPRDRLEFRGGVP